MDKLSQKFEILLKYAVASILVAVSLYPKFPFLRIPSTFVSVRLEDVLIALAFVIFCIYLLLIKKVNKLLLDKVTIAIIFFVIAGFLSLLSAVAITDSVTVHIGVLHWLRRIEYFTPFFMAMFLVKRNRENLNYFFKVILIVLSFAFIYGVGQRYLGWPIVITQNEEYSKGVALRWIAGSHINSTFAGHYDLASFLVLILPIVVSYFFLTKNNINKVILFVNYFAGMWLLVNSASRISLASYLGAVTISLFLIKKYRQIPLVIIVSLTFVLFSSNLLSRYSRIIEVTLEKIGTVSVSSVYAQDIPVKKIIASPTPTPVPVLEDRSTNIRLNVEWPRAMRAFIKNPLLGTGYSSISLATDNDYLRALGETGLMGFLSFCLIFIVLAVNFYRSFPLNKYSSMEKAFIVGIIGSSFGIFLNAMFIDVFEASKFAINYWLLMGLSQGILHRNV